MTASKQASELNERETSAPPRPGRTPPGHRRESFPCLQQAGDGLSSGRRRPVRPRRARTLRPGCSKDQKLPCTAPRSGHTRLASFGRDDHCPARARRKEDLAGMESTRRPAKGMFSGWFGRLISDSADSALKFRSFTATTRVGTWTIEKHPRCRSSHRTARPSGNARRPLRANMARHSPRRPCAAIRQFTTTTGRSTRTCRNPRAEQRPCPPPNRATGRSVTMSCAPGGKRFANWDRSSGCLG